MHWITDLFTNPFLLTALTSWLIAQVLKTVLYAAIHKKLDLSRLVGDGGMPSGHSATVASLAAISALYYGAGSFQFAFSAILAIIVCHDAMGVRLETGRQAAAINEIMESFSILTESGHSAAKLKEFVGHTPIQVLSGILIGIVNAFLMYYLLT